MILRRTASAVVSLLVVTVLLSGLMQWIPGDPLALGAGLEEGNRGVPPEHLEQLRALYHLDRPWPVQYASWLRDLARGRLGRSLHDRRPVAEKIAERLPVTLALNSLALILMVSVAVPLGTLGAMRPGGAWDRFGAAAGFLLYAVPAFWGGLLLQWGFAARLGWLPLYGLGPGGGWHPSHLVLPVVCLSYGGIAYLSRFVRATVADSLSPSAVRALRARGRSLPAAVWIHGFRLAAVPLLTLAGFLLPALLGGSVVVETLFALPGLGRLFWEAMFQRDLPTVLALTLLSGVATLAGMILADAAYRLADPRTREEA